MSAAASSVFRRTSMSVTARSASTSASSEPPHLDTHHHVDTFHHHAPSESHRDAVNNLLYNVPPHDEKTARKTLCALVSNEPGVLSRVAGVLAGRGVNIDSLVVSSTETAGLSRMTIVLQGGSDVDQARKQLEDLVQVWAIVEFSPHVPVVERELLLVKLNVRPSFLPPYVRVTHDYPDTNYPRIPQEAETTHIQRQAIVELTQLFGGKVLDLTPEHIMIELTGKAMRIDAFIELVRPYGIVELARSGVLAMLRGAVTGVGSRGKLKADISPKQGRVDESQLPPG